MTKERKIIRALCRWGESPVSDLDPLSLTSLNGEVCETNGTVTHEILEGSGAVGLDPTAFEIFNDVVLFGGNDSNGHRQLWRRTARLVEHMR
jgi:hypothetical protein